MKAKFLTLGLALTAMAFVVIPAKAQKGGGGTASPEVLEKSQGQGGGQGTGPQAKVNKAEEDAYKALSDPKNADPNKQIQMNEDFAKKFPMSRYLTVVYTNLTRDYLTTGQEDKMFAAGDKALQLDQDNVSVLSILAFALPRRPSANTLDAAQQYDKAEAYAKHAIELIPALTKPAELDDASFEKAKNENLSMAHSGLGLVDFRRNKFADAVTELTQAIMLTASPDPVDYYILGNSEVQTSHFKDAVAAFDKCSASGALATQCTTRKADAQKKASTELSAPSS